MQASPDKSKLHLLWIKIPVIIRSVLSGIIVAAAGTLPWALLVRINIDHFPSIPWSVLPASIYLWFFWRYIKGAGWPKSTSLIRKELLRANSLSSEVWGAAIAAGLLGLISLLIFSGLLNRIVKLPQQDVSELKHVPFISLFFMIVMGSAVAGVVEESAFRGYMQKPIEQKHGPVLAITVSGIVFSLMHYSHAETTFALMPFYFFVATIYGMLAYITNSILPGMILHAAGDVFAGLQVLVSGQSEWQTSSTPQPLIWETGIDTQFLLLLSGMIVIGAITVWAYIKLDKEVKNRN